MSLRKYEGKRVRVITAGGNEYVGKVGDYIWPDDNEECGGCEAIILDGKDGLIGQINAPDIKSIEILE